MANTADTTLNGNFVQVGYSGNGDDWSHSTDAGFANGMHVRAIQWLPSGTDDILVINDGGVDGPSIVHWKATAATDDKHIVFLSPGKRFKPYIDLTDCTFNDLTATKIIFVID